MRKALQWLGGYGLHGIWVRVSFTKKCHTINTETASDLLQNAARSIIEASTRSFTRPLACRSARKPRALDTVIMAASSYNPIGTNLIPTLTPHHLHSHSCSLPPHYFGQTVVVFSLLLLLAESSRICIISWLVHLRFLASLLARSSLHPYTPPSHLTSSPFRRTMFPIIPLLYSDGLLSCVTAIAGDQAFREQCAESQSKTLLLTAFVFR